MPRLQMDQLGGLEQVPVLGRLVCTTVAAAEGVRKSVVVGVCPSEEARWLACDVQTTALRVLWERAVRAGVSARSAARVASRADVSAGVGPLRVY